ncbi:SHOCT domain-containing protein [Leucobacter coleopterorum]|uniref:SHOCT domain-containing protein n=1 Tax=Leucobacter coleopterorum TaxID=2714933 RepID=A0ABX6JVB2_9MICO|nr:SHOCT domain-containing protein [Leucobacter coleopterorum]QIM18252.1 SHOCT domain-containing protein [Leucobacter coleopterorum]
MSFWSSIWDVIWWFLTFFVFIAYLMALFSIIADLFRDRKLNGWLKALWLLFLVFLPFITALVYLIARGRGMGERAERQSQQAREQADAYIRTVAAGSSTPTDEIARAKELLDSGAITQAEFDSLKQAALSKAAAS